MRKTGIQLLQFAAGIFIGGLAIAYFWDVNVFDSLPIVKWIFGGAFAVGVLLVLASKETASPASQPAAKDGAEAPESPSAAEAMMCPECGKKYPLTEVYCPECGSLLKEV